MVIAINRPLCSPKCSLSQNATGSRLAAWEQAGILTSRYGRVVVSQTQVGCAAERGRGAGSAIDGLWVAFGFVLALFYSHIAPPCRKQATGSKSKSSVWMPPNQTGRANCTGGIAFGNAALSHQIESMLKALREAVWGQSPSEGRAAGCLRARRAVARAAFCWCRCPVSVCHVCVRYRKGCRREGDVLCSGSVSQDKGEMVSH